MSVFKKDYAKIYDSLYKNKDYEDECNFIEAIFSKYSKKSRRVLDLGCGTGGHALVLAKRGYDVVGIDRSTEMLEIAQKRAGQAGLPVTFSKGDITALNLREKFDAVISMFAVMSYQTSNDALAAACRTAKKYLIPGGVFLFDCWHGPAVLAEKPAVRIKEIIKDNNERIIRFTNPVLDAINHTVDVKFKVWNIKGDNLLQEVNESHLMRFLFPQEIRYFLEAAGFRDVEFCPFLQLKKTLTEKDWNMMVIARAK